MDPFARSGRPPWLARTRAAPRERDDRVTIACRCGVVMTLAWPEGEGLTCFGCGRRFEAPPHLAGSPKRTWRPDLAQPKPPEPPRAVAGLGRRLVLLFLALSALAALIGLGARLG